MKLDFAEKLVPLAFLTYIVILKQNVFNYLAQTQNTKHILGIIIIPPPL